MAAARWKRYAMLIGWGVVIGSFLSGMVLSVVNGSASTSDFAIYVAAASALRHDPHATIYSPSTLAATHTAYGGCAPPTGWGYLYQPLFAIMLEPLSFLPCGAATAIWEALNVSVMLACIIWLARRMGRRHGAGAALATVAICALCVPLYAGLYYGQVELLILGDCLVAVSLMRRNHPRWAGAVLAAGAFLKYLPILLIIYYLARRRWAIAIGAAPTAAALGLLEFIIVGPATLRASIFGGTGDLLSTLSHSMSASYPYEPYIVCFLVLGVYGAVSLAILRWGNTEDPSAVGMSVGEAWAIGAMAFASPVLWNHYFTWLLPLAVMLLDSVLNMRAGRTRRLWMVGLMTLFALAFINVHPFTEVIATVALWLIGTCALIAQTGPSTLLAWRSRERVAVSLSSR